MSTTRFTSRTQVFDPIRVGDGDSKESLLVPICARQVCYFRFHCWPTDKSGSHLPRPACLCCWEMQTFPQNILSMSTMRTSQNMVSRQHYQGNWPRYQVLWHYSGCRGFFQRLSKVFTQHAPRTQFLSRSSILCLMNWINGTKSCRVICVCDSAMTNRPLIWSVIDHHFWYVHSFLKTQCWRY